MGRSAAVAGGFVLGSIVTIAVNYFLFGKKEQEKKKERSKQLSSSVYAIADLASEGVERVGFLSDIVGQLWTYINVAGGAMIKEIVEPMFEDMLPGPMRTMHFTKIDLGEVPIKIDNVVVHKLKDGMVQFDLDLVWDGECDIRMRADYIGNFGIREVKLNGRMSFLLSPLTNELPIVSAIQYAFVNPPDLELDFTGLAQVADFKLIDKSIRNMMQSIMASMVVLPNRMLYKMDVENDFLETYQPPVGVARITAIKGRGFKVEKKAVGKDDVPDVYCNITFGADPNVWKTSVIKDSLEPEWDESADFLLFDRDQMIFVDAFDEDTGIMDADDYLGSARLTVGEIILAGKTMEVELQDKGKATGAFVTIGCDICDLTPDVKCFELAAKQEKNVLCGLLTILVTRAFDIPLKKEEAATFVKVTYGSSEFLTSAVVDSPGIDALNPWYDCAFQVPLTKELIAAADTPNGDVVFTLINGEKTVLGTTTVTHASLLESPDRTITEKRKIGDRGATLEFRVSLRGVEVDDSKTKPALRGSVTKAVSPRGISQAPSNESLGTVRITVVKGRGFQVQKKMFKKDDIPDAYCNVKIGTSSQVWRTSTIKNSVSPEWNEFKDFSVLNYGQAINIDVFDEDKGKSDADDYIGSAKIPIGKLLLAGKAMDVELFKKFKATGVYITLRCDKIGPR